MISVTRFHDISAGHRVYGHESVCAHLHGHNYRISFTMAMNAQFAKPGIALDSVGRVIDFGVIKSKLCSWLDRAWDHRMLIYYRIPLSHNFQQ